MIDLPPQVNTALQRLGAAGYEACLVGGAVRDWVRRGTGQDWDIATAALPEETRRVFEGCRIIDTGIKHGTVTVIIDGEALEITTYRIDGSYTDHRRPDSVRFTRDLREDLARRDFTMNAMAYHPQKGLFDPFGGREDIAAGLVRCVGEAERRFNEDALRILRALRFAAVFEMTVEAETAAAIHRCRGLLTSIAAERVNAELTKLLLGRGAGAILREYADVLAVVLPEIEPAIGFLQHNPHHDKDVWEHTVAAVEACPAHSRLRWAALLHDLGKPRCFTLDGAGVGHFYGHAAHSTAMAEDILPRLRFDNAAKERILLLIKHHDSPIPTDEGGIKRLLSRFGEEAARQLICLHRADVTAQHPDFTHRLADLDAAEALLDKVLEAEACFSLKDLAIKGGDLTAAGLRGKSVGAALNAALEAVMDGALPNEKQTLLEYVLSLGL